MKHAKKQQVLKETITSSNTVALEEFDQNTTLFNTMTKSNSFNKSPKHRALYHALVESILEDEDAVDKGIVVELKKRKPDDVDKDEGPIARSNRGLKRQRTTKGTETSKKTSTLKNSSKGKSLTIASKSGKSAKEQVKEPIFVKDSDYDKHDDVEFDNTDMPMDQGEDMGKNDKQPKDEVVPNNDYCLNDLAEATKPPFTFDELMHTPIDFSAFVMNRLKIDNLTKEHLVGLVYNLLKGTCKSYVELDYTKEECYRALSEQLDWNNPKGHRCPYDLTKPLHVQMSSQGRQIVLVDFFFNNDLEYLKGGRNDKKYTASMRKSKATRTIIQERVKDLQLGVESYQKKLNLTKPRARDVDMSRRPVYNTL
nr:hypothetical protein [Tanacetum cinerariifolium]